jgi:hypothetical protein
MEMTMKEQPYVKIEVTAKVVEQNHFELTTAYAHHANEANEANDRPDLHVQVLRGTSSAIAPGLSVHAS